MASQSGIVIIITCVSGSKVNSFSRASLLILDSISLAVYWKESKKVTKTPKQRVGQIHAEFYPCLIWTKVIQTMKGLNY